MKENFVEKIDPNLESMTEKETVDFLERNGIQKMQQFVPGVPLLYVFTQDLNENLAVGGRGRALARLDNPLEIDYDYPLEDPKGGNVAYNLKNNGGAYNYAIDRTTGKPVYLSQSKSEEDGAAYYVVKPEYLYVADDVLFPKQ